MNRRHTRIALLALIAATIVPTSARARRTIAGITAYKKSETPRNVSQHRAWALRPGGDAWLFSSDKRRLEHSNFVEFSQRNLPTYAGQRIDCADVAIDNLLRFAKERGLRLTFKVYDHGAHYIDSAQFSSFDKMLIWAKRYLGAHNVTDNSKLIAPLTRLTTPAGWGDKVRPGDHVMWSYNFADSNNPRAAGRPTTVGHTQPILEVNVGATLGQTHLRVMNGDIALDRGEALQAHPSNVWVDRITAVSGGSRLSNYPGKTLFHVLQKYDWNNPVEPGQCQVGQGPLRWGIFQ